MFLKQNLLSKYPEFTEGCKVVSSDNENLGKVLQANDDFFVIEKGFFFPRDFSVRYDDISDVRDGVVYLSISRADVAEWKEPAYGGWSQVEDINTGRAKVEPKPEFRARYEQEATKVPVAEEKLEAQKRVRESGEVRISKVVHTELRHFTVPVMKEEIRVERVAVGGEREPKVGEAAFKEETVTIPLREEEVEVKKRPVVKEEVRVSKDQRIEEQDVSGQVRKEEVKVHEEARPKKKTA